jgi:hypothetical protein
MAAFVSFQKRMIRRNSRQRCVLALARRQQEGDKRMDIEAAKELVFAKLTKKLQREILAATADAAAH